jgi:hypothetical protein
MDELGVNYAIEAGRSPEWTDLVGWAYRAAGTRLLKLPSLPAPLSAACLSEVEFQHLQHLTRALRNGAAVPREPAVQQAWTPLRAFGELLERQGACQRGDPKAQVWFQHLKAALGEELEKLAAQARMKA